MKAMAVLLVVAAPCGFLCGLQHVQGGMSLREGQPFTGKEISWRELSQGAPFTTQQVMRLPDAVAPDGRRWRILVGPNDRASRATVIFRNSEPDVYIENGWILIEVLPAPTGSGGLSPSTGPATSLPTHWGRARTERVSGTVDGSRLLVHNAGPRHHVVKLSGTAVVAKIYRVLPDQTEQVLDEQPITGNRNYRGVTTEQNWPAESAVDQNAELAAIVRQAEEAALVEGW